MNAAVRQALALYGEGNMAGARDAAERAVAEDTNDPLAHGLLGTICARMGDLLLATEHFALALRINAKDSGVRANLATALIAQQRFADAASVCAPEWASADTAGRLWRLRGYALQQLGDYAGASTAYGHVIAGAPDDFESWNNLGNARADNDDHAGAFVALRRAAALRPGVPEVRLNLAAALGRAGEEGEAIIVLQQCTLDFPDDSRPFTELGSWLALLDREAEALPALTRAAALAPDDPDAQVRVALVNMPLQNIDAAEAALGRAIALQPDHEDANLKLAVMLEANNRVDDLDRQVQLVIARGVAPEVAAFVEALALRRRKRFAEALAAADRVSEHVEPVRTAQIRGELLDRLGREDEAWAAFTEMNRQAALADPGDPVDRADRYRGEVCAMRDLLRPEWVASWPAIKVLSDRPDPVFLVGSPRSGTTLLDTLLMGHPRIRVLEEQPALRRTAQQMGGPERIAQLDAAEVATLRARYFAEVDALIPLEPGVIVVDKFPLHLVRMALIHRLFPEARVIFAERHPLDVVLSTFITNFRLNYAMANYLDLGTAAQLYDASMTCWSRATELLPIAVHRVRYERIVADRASELRSLIEFLGLEWSEAALDHENMAIERGNIKTASYSQVTEPIYARASGRWARYRHHLEPILPLIVPWAERMGYPV